MKVNGDAFRQAREEIRKNAGHQPHLRRGEAGVGTQEWLANIAKVKTKSGKLKSLTVRTIQYLEKGEASINTIDAVSPYLGLNGRELIIGYGQSFVHCEAPRAIDFRPTRYPLEFTDNFYKSAVMMTIDPLSIRFKQGELETIQLNNIQATLQIDKETLHFIWLYNVLLTPNAKGWLGIESEAFAEELEAPFSYRSSIMFRQANPNGSSMAWGDFVTLIENTSANLLQMETKITFSSFYKILNIGLSTTQLKQYFALGRKARKANWPYFVQPDALVWQN